MRARRPGARSLSRWGACMLALALGACANKARESSKPEAAPAAAGGGDSDSMKAASAEESEGFAPADELDELGVQVDRAWSELEALDDAREAAAGSEPDQARCARIQGLAQQICELSDRVCGLATEHPAQPRYADACVRSEKTCGDARQAAERCPAA